MSIVPSRLTRESHTVLHTVLSGSQVATSMIFNNGCSESFDPTATHLVNISSIVILTLPLKGLVSTKGFIMLTTH